jgi:hypothetical protein
LVRLIGDQEVQKQRTADAAGAIMFLFLAAVLIIRVTKGVDLSDEAYYAIFLDDWLKGSIASSSLLMLHQTAALIVYPAALLYSAIKGSSEGLSLFLRGIFLLGALVSALAWVLFLRKLEYRLMAWAGGLLIFAFVPFGLPAPSYNTIAQQALTIALASVGSAFLSNRNSEQCFYLIASAFAWAIATVAYPSMVLPLGTVCLLVIFYRNDCFFQVWFYVIAASALTCLAWALVVSLLSFSKLQDSLFFQAAMNDVGGWNRKLSFAIDVFRANATFTVLVLIAIIIGLIRRLAPLFAQFASVVCIALLFATPPAFYVRSHDVVTLATLTGLGLLSGLRRGSSPHDRIIALVYVTSLVAALTTCATAFNSVFNFSIGALPAATLAMVARPSPRSPSFLTAVLTATGVVCVLSTTLFRPYGEIPERNASPRERISNGFFAGLAANADDLALIRIVQDHISPMLGPDQTLAVVGRLPGLVLVTRARLSMLSAFPMSPPVNARVLAMTSDFYEHPENQPFLVIFYYDRFLEFLNPLQAHFEERYVRVDEFTTPLGHLEVFRRR